MISDNDDIMIQRYLDGDMSTKEKQEFEQKLRHTEALQERLENYRLIVEGVRYHGRKMSWQKIMELEAEALAAESKTKRMPFVTNWLFRGIAASLVLVLISYAVYMQQDEQIYARLFEEHFEAYSALGGATRGSVDSDQILPEAFEAYYEKQYERAIILFKQASMQENRPYVWLYLGNAYLSNDQTAEAVTALEKALNYSDTDKNTLLRTYWYLGLAHLKLNQTEEATYYLRMLQDAEDYGDKATSILNHIN